MLVVENLILETAKDLEELNISATLYDMVITIFCPLTVTYVKYDDGNLGCGMVVNTTTGGEKLPLELLEKLYQSCTFGRNPYEIVVEYAKKHSKLWSEKTFYNSVAISTLGALSHRLMCKKLLEKEGCIVEEYRIGSKELFESELRYLDKDDVVTIIGFAYWSFPSLVKKVKEVRVTELINLKQFDVISLQKIQPKIKVYHAANQKEALEDSDVVFITGMSIPNETIFDILRDCKNSRLKILYGPSCFFYPKHLFDLGVDIIRAMKIPANNEFKQNLIDTRGYYPFRSPETIMLEICGNNFRR